MSHRCIPMAKISPAALDVLLAHRQLAPDAPEAGGALIGRILESGAAVVDMATEPTPGDVGTRFAFHRSAEPHQAACDAAHEQSGGTVGYLGEWHTHAEDRPQPSMTDREDWQRHLLDNNGDLVFVIVGRVATRMWLGCKDTMQFTAVEYAT